MNRFLMLMLLSVSLSKPAYAEPYDIAGSWHGELVAARYDPILLVLNIAQNDSDYTATLDIPSQFRAGLPVASISMRDRNIIIRLPAIHAEFYGVLIFSNDGQFVSALDGDWSQSGETVPLRLIRATP
jgi:hypothetical protein